jgi:hypothetical protein
MNRRSQRRAVPSSSTDINKGCPIPEFCVTDFKPPSPSIDVEGNDHVRPPMVVKVSHLKIAFPVLSSHTVMPSALAAARRKPVGLNSRAVALLHWNRKTEDGDAIS